jgi:hypothetical protein
MKRTHITLARLMVVVAVFAVELAVLTVAFRNDESELTRGLPPTGLACQIALLCAVLSRGLSRAFWTGFVVFGCATMATFVWAMCFTESAANDAWASYMENAMLAISSIPNESAPQWLGGDVGIAVILSFPQLAAACVGGVFVFLVTLVMRQFYRARKLVLAQEKGVSITLATE